MELYYAIVNLLDYWAKHDNELDVIKNMEIITSLNSIANLMVDMSEDKTYEEVIESVADANDAGGAKTWYEIVQNFKKQYKNGNRVEVEK